MAGREIKTTLAVDGEQAFKRSLNDAKTSVRNLGTQLTLAQAEFKKDGDAMKLMETRAKALKSEIGAQKEIVAALEGAVKDAAKQYGEGSREAEKWEAELNRAKATMAGLEAELNNNMQGLDRNGKAFDDAGAKADEFSSAVNNISKGVSFELITSGIGKITSGFETAIQKAGELALKMWNMMRDAASWADDEITLAKVYGVDVEELQRMQHAAKMVDVNVETMIGARKRLATAMGKELGSKEITEAFQSLRVPVYDQATGQMRELEEVFWDAGQAIMGMKDPVEQNNAAMKLFGRSWDELKPMFDAGRTKYKGYMEEATVVPQENVEKLGSLQDQLDRLDDQFKTLKLTVLSELAPAFEVLAKCLTELMAEFNAYLQSDEGKEMMSNLQEALTSFFEGLKDVDFGEAVNTLKGALGKIEEAFDWIVRNKEKLVTALGVIAAAFAGLKLTGIVLSLGKIVTGFSSLLGLGGQEAGATAGTAGGGTAPARSPKVTGKMNNLRQRALDTAARTNVSSLTNSAAVMDWFSNNTEIGRWAQNQISHLFGGGDVRVSDGPWGDLNNWAKGMVEAREKAESGELPGFLDYHLFGGKQRHEEWLHRQEVDRLWAQDHPLEPISQQDMPAEPAWMTPELRRDYNARFGTGVTANDKEQWWLSQNTGLAAGPAVTGNVSGVVFEGSGHHFGGEEKGGLTSQDVNNFNRVPADITAAVRNAISGWRLTIDGKTAAAILAPYVSVEIARDMDQ